MSTRIGNSTLRGGQTVFHGIRMWGQLLSAGMFLAAISVVAVPAWHAWQNTTGYEWYAAAIVTVAEMKLAIGYQEDSRQEVRMHDGRTAVLTITEIASSPRALVARERLKDGIYESAFQGLKFGVLAIVILLAVFWFQGRQLNREKRIRGAELATARQLRRQVLSSYSLSARFRHTYSISGNGRPYRIAGVPYPEWAETQHTIVSGTTGSGKTVLISDLVAQIRDRGERCVIYDKMGSYTRSFYDPERDVLMNPLDARAPRWVGLGATAALPYGFTVGIREERRRTGYEGRWNPFTPDGTAREDDTRILRVSAYNRAFTLKGFSPEIVLVNEARTSNAQLYGYRRDRAELRFVRQF